MAAADLLIHPSLLDSSCISVKEASLVQLPAIVCQGTGDFDSYIVNGVNGYRIKEDEFTPESVSLIQKLAAHPDERKTLGRNLQRTVLERFDINKTYHFYEQIHKTVSN
jgi:glycosyltransferase involved in cell wall biosynthesis